MSNFKSPSRVRQGGVDCDSTHSVFCCRCCCVTKLCLSPWDPRGLYVARQAPLSMGFPRQEHWSGLPFPPPGNLPNPGIKPASPALAGGFFTAHEPKMDKA